MGLRRYLVVFGVGVGGLLAIAALPSAGGCTFDNMNTADSGELPPDDTGGDDADADAAVDLPTVLDPATQQDIPADFSCLGKRDGGVPDASPSEVGFEGGTPSDGQLVPMTIDLYSFNEGNRRLAGAQIDLYYANTFKAGAPDVAAVTTDDAGLAVAPMPAGWEIAYHVLPKDDPTASNTYIDYYELDRAVGTDPSAKLQFFGMTKETFQTLALAIAHTKDYTIPNGVGIAAVRSVDCQRRYVRNLTVQVDDVTDATPKPLTFVKDCTAGPCIIYMSDLELPSSETKTSRSGLVAMVNLPSDRKLRMTVTGYADGNPTAELGHRTLEIVDHSITTQYVQP